jgi:glutathione S-transferase
MTNQQPILYSFRRCPYAIRARFALLYAGIAFELREVKLANKPAPMLAISPKGTVPVLQLTNGQVIDESVDIVAYALSVHDPEQYALTTESEKHVCQHWLTTWQPQWVQIINHYKYHDRYPELNREETWEKLKILLTQLDNALQQHGGYALRPSFSALDILLLPLIRQFAIIDDAHFRAQGWHAIECWLDNWMQSAIYADIMQKQAVWQR